MICIMATKDSETGKSPSERLLREMGNFNDELIKAGIMLSGEGLKDSSQSKRVRFNGSQRTVIDGPFAETKELVAGFWIWQVKSMAEAVDWVKRIPNPDNGDANVDIRPIFETEDFGAEMTPELRAQEERQRAALAQKP